MRSKAQLIREKQEAVENAQAYLQAEWEAEHPEETRKIALELVNEQNEKDRYWDSQTAKWKFLAFWTWVVFLANFTLWLIIFEYRTIP